MRSLEVKILLVKSNPGHWSLNSNKPLEEAVETIRRQVKIDEESIVQSLSV